MRPDDSAPRRSRPSHTAQGRRAAAWFGQHAAQLAPDLTPEQVAAVQYCVLWHVPDDRHCPNMTPELQCLKDADGLDRVRLGDFDPRYLRLPHLRGREADARALVQACQSGGDVWAALRTAAQARGLWPSTEPVAAPLPVSEPAMPGAAAWAGWLTADRD